LLDACVRDRDKVPDGQIVDVMFDRLVSEPLAVIEETYSTAGLEFPDDVRGAMQACLNANERGKHGRLVYNMKRDFGLEASDIRPRFREYLDRFRVRWEVG